MTRAACLRDAIAYRRRMRVLGYGPIAAVLCALRFYRYMRAG